MAKKSKADKRAKEIEKAMRITIASLLTHLPWTHSKFKNGGGKKFHKKTIEEYINLLSNLEKLY